MIRLAAMLLALPVALTAQQTLPATFATHGAPAIRIWVPSGAVRLQVWDRDSIRVTGTVAAKSHFFGGAGQQGAKLGVEADDMKSGALGRGDLVVTLPRTMHVWIKMTEGNIIAAGTDSEVVVLSVAGSVDIHDAKGVVSVETIDAKVSIQRVEGAVTVHSGGGAISIGQLRATLMAASVSGSIDVGGDQLQDARIETVSGPVTLRGGVVRDAIVDIETHGGAISLALDPAALPLLSLVSRGGGVANPLGTGSVAAGRIVAHSFKGRIIVRSAKEP